MLDSLIGGFILLAEPAHLLALVGGVLLGLLFGAVPGLGGIVGLALLLPFSFHLEPTVAIALMVGLFAVTATGDIIPAVLLGVPGTAGSQATILDGYPMARKGEATRALGAAFFASVLGGIIGAVILVISIPILRPLILAFGSPEFFMLGLVGITMVAALSAGSVLRGFLAAGLGLALAMVGAGPQSAYLRWTFDSVYLSDGIPFVPLVLGLFAIPEMIELYVKGTPISERVSQLREGTLTRIALSFREVLRNWFLVLRCSVLGAWIGAIPGLGSSVVDWFAYGHALTSVRGAKDSFGKGDVRGVIAPESASNSKSAGALIPTLAFGIPGSPAMAVFLGGLLFHNIIPGPQMLTRDLDTTLFIIAGLVLANIIGAAICLALIRHVGKLATVPAHYLVPGIFVVCLFASFQTNWHHYDLLFLIGFSILGWSMKVGGWSRPALILAFVLGPILEQYYFLSVGRFGFEWLTRPAVMALAGVIVATFIYSVFFQRSKKDAPSGGGDAH
jgi:TctA family transporter